MTKRSKKKDAAAAALAAIEALTLPSFVTFAPTKAVLTLSAVDGLILVDKDPARSFSTPSEAYDAMRKLHGEDIAFVFDKSLNQKKFGELLNGMFFAAKDKDSNFSRLLLSWTSGDEILGLKYTYADFLKLDKEFRESPEDWTLAYRWLRAHPVFWYVTPTQPFSWVTDDGFEHVWTWVTRHKGKSYVALEHGAAVDPERTHHYHDPRFDVSAPSFEKAYLKLAKKVDKYYNTDGSEK